MVDAIGRDIVTGAYDRMPFPTEADLSRHHDVSRQVTREAVKMLTAKGLLVARPRSGTRVSPSHSWNLLDPDVLGWLLVREFSLDLLRQFNELRMAIEPAAARLAARNANGEQRAQIVAGLERMRLAEEGRDDTLDADIEFHVAILRASGNPFFFQMRAMVATALRTSIRFTNTIVGRSASVADHAAVCDAILRGDDEGASRAMRYILGEVLELIDRGED
ncbi:FadR/GntR family transcriptional regulator [Sphingomonas sp.]|uniref:FadR/GntR family transcriptional regulator n=1 Tax=Sphingomonas sp. TaxID=28214 RepID=UPI001ECAA899|nr:FadR/GntR family transcriptional regulator [Sphingomonas sp.]MBX3595833.1 FadR family transcriptional regulator [Sphingomonas sp.]